MLEGNTVLQLLILVAAALPILLQRLPKWDALNPNAKKAIVAAVNILAAFAIGGAKQLIPAAVLDANAANFAIGLFMAAGSFVVHLIDTWLDSLPRPE